MIPGIDRYLRNILVRTILLVAAMLLSAQACALDKNVLEKLSHGDSGEKIELINQLGAAGDASVLPILDALDQGNLSVAGERVVIETDGQVIDAATMKKIEPAPADLEKIVINNRIRRALNSTLSALKLSSSNRDTRLAAAEQLQNKADEDFLPIIDRAVAKEKDEEIKSLLLLTQASINLKSTNAAMRLEAVKRLAESTRAGTEAMLLPLLDKNSDGSFLEPDSAVRAQAKKSLGEIQSRLAMGEYIGRVFSGISLGSILLLAALGLAITYGLMGVINMAHGELLMIGAYTTYVVQHIFHSYMPGIFNWYILVAVPASFVVSAGVGMVLERTVIRHLYGRPLETLLATWGISLILIQAVRGIFGAQNVEVMNPAWMSGGLHLVSNLVLPYNRIAIIGFALIVLLLVWGLLNRTRLGLFVRAVTQNRTMADCVGVHTRRIDMWAFGLGSGIAGLGGCALSQIGNVGPELGQSYIVDSFMVVVLGGVGQLAGTVVGGLGLGVVNKFLEPFSGAVLAKIMILVFIIVFIQKRPQGLFALKGRMVEN